MQVELDKRDSTVVERAYLALFSCKNADCNDGGIKLMSQCYCIFNLFTFNLQPDLHKSGGNIVKKTYKCECSLK